MNLRAWITADLAAIRMRLTNGVVGLVPAERWVESVPAPTDAHGASSTIAGLLLHLGVHHDLAVSTAILDRAPLFEQWRGRLGLEGMDPETGLAERESREAVDRLDPDALVGYVDAVFDQTTAWVAKVAMISLDSTAPNCRRLEQRAGVRAEVVPWFHAMWDGKSVGWLVQWEVVGHAYSHLGEMTAIRNQLGLSPF